MLVFISNLERGLRQLFPGNGRLPSGVVTKVRSPRIFGICLIIPRHPVSFFKVRARAFDLHNVKLFAPSLNIARVTRMHEGSVERAARRGVSVPEILAA